MTQLDFIYIKLKAKIIIYYLANLFLFTYIMEHGDVSLQTVCANY